MKKTALLCTGILVGLYAIAQTYAIDSMARIIRGTAHADSNKVRMCLKLCSEWLKINPDSALVYANKSYELASTANYPEGLADARAMQANICKVLGQYDKAYEMYLEALHKYTMLNNQEGIGNVYVELGNTFHRQDNYSKALLYFQQALNAFNRAGSKGGLAKTHLQIGIVHSKVNETAQAITHFQQAAEAALLAYDRATAIESYNLLCKEHSSTGHYHKALQAATRAKNLALISGLVPALGEANYNLGKAYSDLNFYDSAHVAYKAALTYFLQAHNKERIAKTYDGIGEVYYWQNDFEHAIQSIKISNQYALDLEDKNLLQVNYSALMAISRAQGDYKMASEYFDQVLALKDTIFNTDKNRTIAKMRSAYELEKKQAMIAALQKDNIEKTQQRNLFIVGFSILVVLLLALGYSIIHIYQKNKVLHRQKVELEELNLVKDKFFSIIGHDLRSPMANILGLLQLLAENDSIGEQDRRILFEKLINSTSSALETMDNLLTWGMNQIRQSVTEKREIDIQEITERVCRFLQQSAEKKSVQLVNRVTEPTKIWADKNQVEFILRNLVSNALKFSHKNGVVELWASNEKGAKNIHIRDTGTGMTQEVKHKLFDEKKHASTKGTAGETGSGLGLLLSKQFIHKNNGTLQVRSELGKGSVFTVSLPQANGQ